MEIFEILGSAGVGGAVVLLMIRIVDWLRTRDTSDAQAEARQDTKELTLIDLLRETMQTQAKLSEHISQNTNAIIAQTGAINANTTLIEGGRRDHQIIIGALADDASGLAALASALDAQASVLNTLPERTAQATGEKLSPLLDVIVSKVTAASQDISSALSLIVQLKTANDTRKKGDTGELDPTKLQQAKAARAESTAPESGETMTAPIEEDK